MGIDAPALRSPNLVKDLDGVRLLAGGAGEVDKRADERKRVGGSIGHNRGCHWTSGHRLWSSTETERVRVDTTEGGLVTRDKNFLIEVVKP